MSIVKREHECEHLRNQTYDSNNFTAVQELKINKNVSWYLVNCSKGISEAFGIVYCPYCGELLAELEER